MTTELDDTIAGPVVPEAVDDAGDPVHEGWITDDDFDRYAYAHSFSNRFKQGWIVF